MSFTVIVRAFNKDGYHKDILSMDVQQVRMQDNRIDEASRSLFSGLIGVGGSICSVNFPEMTSFEVVIKEHR